MKDKLIVSGEFVSRWADKIDQDHGDFTESDNPTRDNIIAMLEEIGIEVEEEPELYRCECCGKEFDHKVFSHTRTEMGFNGQPVPVECGPIVKVED